MIKNRAMVDAFENQKARMAPPDFFLNLRIVESLRQEAWLLGALPLKDPLEGIEVEIHLAKVLNVRTAP